ncbi:MAG TPA: 50S ribosomal protein L11 methyltransferase [Thermoanaerobaculia bacterium]|nr:50S ribosomal protein L11 methyltransferase [Thermoanaerobaculia bacterium]
MTDFILEITCDPSLFDVVQGRLFLTPSTGNSTAERTISAYFDSPAARTEAAEALRDLPVECRSVDRPSLDWLARYEQSLEPLFIGHSFLVAPEASLIPPDAARHRLVVPQEQAFGTGSHESTALCIELLEQEDLRGASALDIGSGSGILAMAMLRLGARKAVALDIDPDAFRPLRENRRRNGIAPAAMPFFIGGLDALRGGSFDAVTMNILPDVIVASLPAVKRHVGGMFIVSGILGVQREVVVDSCQRHGLRLAREAAKGEWWAGTFRPAAGAVYDKLSQPS